MSGYKVLISEQQIQKRIAELGAEISQKLKSSSDKPLVVIGVLKGSFIFLADLVRKISTPLEIDFVEASSYGAGTTSSGEVKLTRDIKIPIAGRDVILVEDIVDTGHTISFLTQHLAAHKPRSISVASLLFKPARQIKEVKIDFLGFTIDDYFVIGYGLDLNNKFREIKEVVIYEPSK
ncbi:MAG: hypoxanthine phosphoribosyltransferase [Deltaproteobacteria bacterium]|nr:hypoxanthine phosphoribosyltransferase [Deltaproteobacteria bacterium]